MNPESGTYLASRKRKKANQERVKSESGTYLTNDASNSRTSEAHTHMCTSAQHTHIYTHTRTRHPTHLTHL